MNTLKTTMSKIAQIEQPERTDLAKHEVELGLMQDVKSNLSKFEKGWQQSQTALNQIDAKKREYVAAMIDASKVIKKQIDVLLPIKADLKTLETQAKELGLNISDSKEYQNAVTVTNDISHQRLEQIIFSITDAQKAIKDIKR